VIVASTTGIPVRKPGFPTPAWRRWAMPASASAWECGEFRSPEPERVRPSAASGGQGGGQGPQVWEPSQGPHDRVGEGELRLRGSQDRVGEGELRSPQPERGRVWEGTRGSEDRVGEGELCSPQPERGRVWEPSQGSHFNRAVALMVEQRSPKPRVVGSSPACPARSRAWKPQGFHYKGA
jgi:hypothetical protein